MNSGTERVGAFTKSRAVHGAAHIKPNKNLHLLNRPKKSQQETKSNLGSLGLAQTILLLKDLGVLLEVLLDHLREAEGKKTHCKSRSAATAKQR